MESNKKIFITGVSGFLGSEFAIALARCGYRVSGCSRRSPPPYVMGILTHHTKIQLGEDLPREILSDTNVLIHTAHSFKPSESVLNIQGTKHWFEQAQQCGIQQQIFISSYAARSDSRADYGRIKYTLEQLFLSSGYTVIRPGLVVGNGGIFKRMVTTASQLPIIPIFDGGKQMISLIPIQVLNLALVRIVSLSLHGEYNLFYSSLWKMIDLICSINQCLPKKKRIISIHSTILIFVLDAIKRIGLALPFSSENIRSLLSIQKNTYPSDLQKFGVHNETNINAMICEWTKKILNTSSNGRNDEKML